MMRSCPRLSRRLRAIASVLALLGMVAIPLAAQNPILEFSFESDPVTIPQASIRSASLRVENISVHEADNIEIALLSGPIEVTAGELIDVLGAFSDVLLNVPLSADADARIGEALAQFELTYTYCIGDLCFQIVEEVSLGIDVVAALTVPIDGPLPDPIVAKPVVDDGNAWRIVVPLGLGLLLALALIASRWIGRRWWVTLLLVGVLAVGLGYGISLKQDQQAQSIGAVLCTSCVGIEETPHRDPELSDDGQQRVMALTERIELLLFSAPWCHACPYAKELVRQVTELNSLITNQVIDVDEDRDAADRNGIIQSGRTIVPAILRVDTGEVLFGIEDLEERLMTLLEESP
ncbi:MAG: hypothetical protein E4H08_05730 [Candidatus Atribacteria bacterium]|nr:MAG: hypothetical protein E4H08_05730 [Candidatus Atribacteria bacterium]